jgi:hypothetical protein
MDSRALLNGDDAWSTRNTALAAALGTLGVKVKSEKQTRVISRARGDIVEDPRLTFHLGMMPRESTLSTQALIKRLRSGQLEREMPDHPLLDALGGTLNRECLLEWLKNGTRMRLAQCGPGRTRYIPGEETEAMKRLMPMQLSGTRDLKIVAALGRVGIPLIRWDGPRDHRIFWVATKGHNMQGLFHDADDLVKRLRSGELEKQEPAHPFLIAWEGLRNFNRLLDHLHREKELLLLTAPGTQRAAFLDERATGKAHDRAADHLKNGSNT